MLILKDPEIEFKKENNIISVLMNHIKNIIIFYKNDSIKHLYKTEIDLKQLIKDQNKIDIIHIYLL